MRGVISAELRRASCPGFVGKRISVVISRVCARNDELCAYRVQRASRGILLSALFLIFLLIDRDPALHIRCVHTELPVFARRHS